MSIGTDTTGSLLMPATRGDVYAMKPTLGLVDADGVVPVCRDMDCAGPIARCAADIAHLLDAMVVPGKSGVLSRGGGGYQSWLTGDLEGMCVGVLDPRGWHLPGVVAKGSVEFDEQQVRGHMLYETVLAFHSHPSQEEDILKAYDRLVVAGAQVRKVQLPPLDGLEVDGVSHIAQVMGKFDSRGPLLSIAILAAAVEVY